jgi:hypothetical protein
MPEGQWCGGVRHGSGTLAFEGHSQLRYAGAWHQDQKHGWGMMQYPSGALYEGDWFHDKKHGFGTMYWTSRMERYRGAWKNNKPDGVGEHVWYGGAPGSHDTHAAMICCNRYVGMHSGGHRQGEGCMQYASGTEFNPC